MATKKATVKDETHTPESGVRVVKEPTKVLATSEEIAEFQQPDRIAVPSVQSETAHASQAAEDIRDAQVAEPNA